MVSDTDVRAMAARMVEIPGIRAVVLGGSRARGTHGPDSDVDLGLYYDRGALDAAAIARLADLASDLAGTRTEIAGPGQWGPWVDGGGWLSVDGTAVDWILRDVDRVREQCARARRGDLAFHHQTGHPLGFLDVSYAGEVAVCVPIEDPHGLVPALREGLDPYPTPLRDALVPDCLSNAEFHADVAHKGAAKQDVAYVAQCCSKALMLCAHAWHATAGAWVLNEKGLVPGVARLDPPPSTTDPAAWHDTARAFAADARDALAHLGSRPNELSSSVDAVRRIVGSARQALAAPPRE